MATVKLILNRYRVLKNGAYPLVFSYTGVRKNLSTPPINFSRMNLTPGSKAFALSPRLYAVKGKSVG